MDIKIIVASHKAYQMPKSDIYLPVHVGAENKEPISFCPDNTGDNISYLNPYFCELTGMYWAWKNLDNDYLGLCHYRRYFSTTHKKSKNAEKLFEYVLNRVELEKVLQSTDIVLPKKRNYIIENLFDHYAHTSYIETLNETGKIISEKCPEYSKEFEKLHSRKKAHMFNMCIMKKELFSEYCEWLFGILFELTKRINPSNYTQFHARYPGRISELLLDVWIYTNHLDYKEIPVIDMEKVNWAKKGFAFLKSKFLHKKYEKSF